MTRAYLLVSLLACGVLLPFLGAHRLASWDEAIYAQISREMLSHDWLIPHYFGAVWFEKPPLYMWLTAGLFRSFGVTELAARLVSAVAGVGVALCVFGIARKVSTSIGAWLAVLVLFTTPLFVRQARFGTTDVLLTLTFCAALWWYASEKPYRLTAYAICFGVAVMTKGAAAVILFTPLLATLRTPSRRDLFIGAAAFLAMVAPWHLFMVAEHGRTFFYSYLVTQALHRAVGTGQFSANQPWYFYIAQLRNSFGIWWTFLPLTLYVAVRRRSWLLLGSWVWLFLAYSLIRVKFDWYLLPAYPLLALITGIALAETAALRYRRAMLALGCAVLFAAALKTYRAVHLDELSRDSAETFISPNPVYYPTPATRFYRRQ